MASGGTLPTGVVTFLLTDVVGSTELWDHAPDAMAAAITRHEVIVSEAVSSESGLLLKTKGEGDSTFSVFARTTDGLRAAYRLQRALRLEPWPADAPLSTRVAVHTGEAVERDGDYFGPAVNLVARLRGAALGGQVLVSATTATIGRKALPDGCDLVELGPIEFRGITDPEVVWALVGPDIGPFRVTAASPARSAHDDHGLSRREAEVQSLVAENLTNAEIAARLSVSERTVESLVASLARKLGVETRVDLVHISAKLATRADGALDRPSLPATLELLADSSSFVGRDAERAVLRQRWERARAGHTLLAIVSGEAGIGKSRLASELAAEIHADGGRVLFGACYEDVDQPYAPFVQAISAEMSGLDDAKARRRAGRDREALARLSPDLARSLSVPDGRGDVAERGAIVDAIRRWIVGAGTSTPSLIVIEDVHWATASTRDVLRDLLRRAGHDPVLVLATTRDTAPDVDADLSALLADLQRSPATTSVPLGGLEPHDVAALLQVSSADSRAIAAETGGNPLFITHVSAGARIGPLPTLLERRNDLLDEQSRVVLDLAATMGVEFDADVLAVGQQLPLLAVLASLERAEAAGLVVSLPGSRFGFVHALFRSHRYDRLPLTRRLELHAHAARALATRNGRQLSEQARHACLAVPLIDARRAVELARAAGDAAERAYAYDEAASHYQRGLEAAQSLEPPDPRMSLDLTVRLAAAVHHSDDPRGPAMLIDAADRARREGDTAALARVATSFTRFGTSGAFAGPAPAQLAVIKDALTALGPEPSPTRALLLVELAAQISGVRVDDALQLAGEAEAIARAVGDPELLGRVLLGQRLLGHHPSRLEEFERIATELDELGRRTGSLGLTFIALYDRAVAHLERGQVEMWSQLGEQAARLLGDRSLIVLQLHARSLLATRSFLSGDLEATEQQALSTTPLAVALGHEPLAWSGGILVVNRRLQARDREMLPVVESIEPRGAFTAVRYVLAAVQARVGAVDDALHTLASLRDDGYPIQKTHPWMLAMSELAEAAEVAGDPESADHVLARCSPFTGRIAVAGPCANRPFDQALAQAALAAGDIARAENYASRAVAASRQRGTPLFLARELVFLAEARRRNGGQTAELRPLVAEALALARRHSARAVAVDVDRYGLPA